MNKHNSLTDLGRLIVLHKRELEIKPFLSMEDLVLVLVESSQPLAKSFTYVYHSMKGSQDDQYRTVLDSLSRHGHRSAVSELKRRQNLPCIDLQESMFLLNRDSKRDRNCNYNYPDYNRFAKCQYVSGRANRLAIDWKLLLGEVQSESSDTR